MKTVTKLIEQVPIPRVVRVRQKFDRSCIPDAEIPAVMRRELEKLGSQIQPGMRIAITCGSRGIHCYRQMVKTMVEFVKERGAAPFLVAAMGSHGGATAKGQRQILADYGITEETMGCPVKCDMDTVEIGKSILRGKSVRIDKNAAEADGILLLNRVKPIPPFGGDMKAA